MCTYGRMDVRLVSENVQSAVDEAVLLFVVGNKAKHMHGHAWLDGGCVVVPLCSKVCFLRETETEAEAEAEGEERERRQGDSCACVFV